MENWIDLPNYEGYYKVSNTGKILSLERVLKFGWTTRIKPEQILKTYINNKGYYCVDLYKDTSCKKMKLHRLIAMAFKANPSNLPEVNHKDGDKSNNHASNLEWCTHSYNHKHAYANKLSGLYKRRYKNINNSVNFEEE